MTTRVLSQHLGYRRLANSRPPARAVKFSLALGRHQLTISCRRFTTPAHRRSNRFRQWVVPTPVLSFRETAIAIRSKRSRKTKVNTNLALASLLTFSSLLSIGYFVIHLQARPDLSLPVKSSSTPLSIPKPLPLTSAIQNQKISLLQPAPVPKPKTKPAPLPTVMTRSMPLRIAIPSIQLDTTVFSEGLGLNKSISMPNVFDQVGWYDKSPTPGERGPAVLTGHVDSTQGIAIFWRLRELVPGNIIKIGRQDGTTATFQVTKIAQFPQDRFPTEAVYGPINYAGIRLVTCGGTFSTATGHYDQNTVVYGRLI